MQSVLLSNPIYKHSGESEKQPAIAQQASVNEDQELRRRLLDKNGEKQKKLVATEVAHMVSQFGGDVHLKHNPIVEQKESLLVQAQHVASDATKAVTDATSNAVSSAASTAASIKQTTTSAAGSIFNTLVGTVNSVASTAAALTHDAAAIVSQTAKDANAAVHHAAHEAQHKASDITHKAQHKATDIAHKAVDAAVAVKEKTFELAHEASNKAHELADNISHFATLVSVLAEEENERARRLVSGDEARAAANAFRVSALIKELDPCFYKQTPNLHYGTKLLEETERRWRLNSNTNQLAESNAHKEGKLMSKGFESKHLQSYMPRYQWVRAHIASIEEKERSRRLNDSDEAWAMINAFALSSLVSQLDLCFYRQGTFSKAHSAFATTLLEENERRSRIRLDKFHRLSSGDSAHHLMDIVSHNIEKFQDSTRNAARFASEFANLVGSATLKMADQFSTLTKDLAETATERVKTVAKDISSFSSLMYVIALEEKERARRIADTSSEQTAIHNAWFQSQLIRELSGLYRSTSIARFPLSLIEEPERAWRIATIQPSASKKIAALVLANLSKFQAVSQHAAELEHAKNTAAHSHLNPNAPSFVPHQALPVKVEPAFVQPTYRASGAQL